MKQPSRPTQDTGGSSRSSSGGVARRTRRACDRCRNKKAKCDGNPSCKTCRSTGSTCLYTAKRGREARSYYFQMRNLMDEALLKLYWACRTNSGFPGELPDESNGPITTEVILKALGLVGPDFDEQVSFLAEAKDQDSHLGNPQRAETQARNRMPLQPATPSESDGSSAEGSHSVAARQTPTTSPHSPLFHSRSNTFSNPLSTTTTMTTPMPTPTPTKATFQELPALVSAQSTAHIPQPAMKVQPGVGIANGENDVESYLDVDAFLDTSVSPEHINTSGSFDQGMQPFNGLSLDQTGHFSPPQQGYFMSAPPIRDDYLYPWPGSLAAAYQAVPNV